MKQTFAGDKKAIFPLKLSLRKAEAPLGRSLQFTEFDESEIFSSSTRYLFKRQSQFDDDSKHNEIDYSTDEDTVNAAREKLISHLDLSV